VTGNDSVPIIFGGDLQSSILGDQVFADEFYSYIDNHPWIQVLSNTDLPNYQFDIFPIDQKKN
jgi:hypothetical protein